MLNDINGRFTRAKERSRRKQKLESMLRESQKILTQEQRNCNRHEQILASEKADVDKLEGLSLTGLFYSILGTKEERLETERQEHLAAKLKLEACSQAVGDAQQEVERLFAELADFQDAENEYVALVKEKEAFLTQTGDHRAETLDRWWRNLHMGEAFKNRLGQKTGGGRPRINL